jgi:hypothetical protein
MPFVFDTNAFIIIGHYYPDQFPTFWERFNTAVASGEIVSVRETMNELSTKASRPWLAQWVKDNSKIFRIPTAEETAFVSQIFSIPHFQMLVSGKARLAGKPAADPFIIAAARVFGGTVVSEESKKPNAARIPNVCEHFGIPCLNVEGFLAEKKWTF